MKYYYLYILIILSLFFINTNDKNINYKYITFFKSSNDSIKVWIDSARNRNLNPQKRKTYLKRAYKESLNVLNDSLRNNYLSRVSFTYYKLDDSLAFRATNKQVIQLSIKLKDSSKIADSYWDLARFHSKKGVKDSAYYNYSKAQKLYESLNNNYYTGRMFLNMAIMQSDIKDYTGSEISTIKAIALLKPLEKSRHLYRCYNNLGINFNELQDYDEALFYHNKALEYQKKIKGNNTFKEATLNNLGVVFKNKEDYNQAINYYKLALKNERLKNGNIKLYAKLLNNLAYSKLKLGDTSNANSLFFESLKIRDSVKDFLGIAINKLHLAEYYLTNKDTIKSLQFALETKQLATDTKNYRDLLSSLMLLSKLDKKNSAVYTNQYIRVNDSLQKEERAIRNKFARIRFETDEFIDENKRLSKQRNLIILISGLSLLFGFLLYVIKNQRTKNKELKFEQQQQLANEEIYNLMITQQNKLDEGSKKEKKRISEELHDGVLGKLFGTRLLLGSLNTNTDEESILKREKFISDLQEIEEEVRNVSHELNSESLMSNFGFKNMIYNLLEDQSQITNFDYELINDENIIWEEIDGLIKMNLYRIIQEGVQNINKYAKAKNVLIEFKRDENYLFLIIKDDGIGFNSNIKRKGIGLKNMISRTKKLRGKIVINSQQKKGALITINIPFDQKQSIHNNLTK